MDSGLPDAELRARLLDLVRRITTFDGGPGAHDGLIVEFARLAPHPRASDFIFRDDLPADEIVARAMAYRPIELPTRDGYPPPAASTERTDGFAPPRAPVMREPASVRAPIRRTDLIHRGSRPAGLRTDRRVELRASKVESEWVPLLEHGAADVPVHASSANEESNPCRMRATLREASEARDSPVKPPSAQRLRRFAKRSRPG